MKLSEMPKPEAYFVCRTTDGVLHTFDKRANYMEEINGIMMFKHSIDESHFTIAAVPVNQIYIIECKEKGAQIHGKDQSL